MDPQKLANADASRNQKKEFGFAVDTKEAKTLGKIRDVIVKKEELKENEKGIEPKQKSFVLSRSCDDLEKTSLSVGRDRPGKVRAGHEAIYIDNHPTAQRFIELQAQLGFDQSSKVLDWLMDAAAPAITNQEQLHLSKFEQDAYAKPSLSLGTGKMDHLQIQELPKDQVKENEKLRRREIESSSSNSIYHEGSLADWLQSKGLRSDSRDLMEDKSLDLSLSLGVPEVGSGTSYSINDNETLSAWLPKGFTQVTRQEETFSSSPTVECSTNSPVMGKNAEFPLNSALAFRSHKRRSYSSSQNINLRGNVSVGTSACESYASNTRGVVVPEECLNCLLFCGIFPKDYEIDHDTLTQLWMAAGFVVDEPMEDVAARYLQILEHENAISFLRKEPSSGKKWYKINHLSLPKGVSSGIKHFKLDSGNSNPLSSNRGGPCHVTVQHSSIDFDVLKSFTEMRTLLFLHRHGSCFERMPDSFFLSLKNLKILDLSGTGLLELSSSIRHAECLYYLDLSHTLVKQLPETLGCLCSLQTLKLRKCPRLIALPKGITKLNGLRHLEFDTPSRTCFMPPGMGRLTSLCTLLEFPVSADYGCTIQELKNMSNLKGSLCLSGLDNIESLDEAEEANLCSKQWLKKLELRWSQKKRRNTRSDDHIIACLKPHTNIQDLRILCFRGSTFPTWISDPSFASLVNITLFKCENCLLPPSLGLLPSLESLCLFELSALKVIDYHPCQDIAITDAHTISFPRLQKLEIISMFNLECMRDPEKYDFPCLVEMTIKDCPKLVTLWNLSGFSSLKSLEINDCRMLPSLPGKHLSIETLVIEGCPLLCSSCSNDGQDSHTIFHVPNVFINQLEVPSFES